MSRRWPALAGSLLLLAAACGVPTDDAPRAIPHDRVPFRLLEPDQGPSPVQESPEGAISLTVYLVSGERLTPVTRDVPPPVGPEEALQALLGGVTAHEAARGMRSAIAPATGARTTAVSGGEVRIDLTRAFLGGGTKEQILAVAQIVYTITALPGLDGVTFTLSGRSIEVPAADGTLRAGAMRRSDFASVAQL